MFVAGLKLACSGNSPVDALAVQRLLQDLSLHCLCFLEVAIA